MTGATINDVLTGAKAPHELPWDLWLLWADGFHAGCRRMQPKLARAERDADYWYYVANNPADVRADHERRLRDFNIAQSRRSSAERWAARDRAEAERAEVARVHG